MQSYGMSELVLDMSKAKKAASLEYITMREIIDDEDVYMYQIESGEDLSDKLKNAIDSFIDKIMYELEVEAYPRYISSEAEGTDRNGEIIWCITPEYQPAINAATSGRESWSEFG